MSPTGWLLLGGGVLAAYAVFVLGLVVANRRSDARALAGFIPDCVVLLRRLIADPRVARGTRWMLAALFVYLVIPVDLVPDFIPVAGQLDDALVAALALRRVIRAAGAGVVREHWPGPPASLALVLRLAGA